MIDTPNIFFTIPLTSGGVAKILPENIVAVTENNLEGVSTVHIKAGQNTIELSSLLSPEDIEEGLEGYNAQWKEYYEELATPQGGNEWQ